LFATGIFAKRRISDAAQVARFEKGRKPSPRSLDIPFHGHVNFDLRANTDIEDKLFFWIARADGLGKREPGPVAKLTCGQRGDNGGKSFEKKRR
jgi:hypothetical protein